MIVNKNIISDTITSQDILFNSTTLMLVGLFVKYSLELKFNIINKNVLHNFYTKISKKNVYCVLS